MIAWKNRHINMWKIYKYKFDCTVLRFRKYGQCGEEEKKYSNLLPLTSSSLDKTIDKTAPLPCQRCFWVLE